MVVYAGPRRGQFCCHGWAVPRLGRAFLCPSGAFAAAVSAPGADCEAVSLCTQRSVRRTSGRRVCRGWVTLARCFRIQCNLWPVVLLSPLPSRGVVKWWPFQLNEALELGSSFWVLTIWCLFQTGKNGSYLGMECVLNTALMVLESNF